MSLYPEKPVPAPPSLTAEESSELADKIVEGWGMDPADLLDMASHWESPDADGNPSGTTVPEGTPGAIYVIDEGYNWTVGQDRCLYALRYASSAIIDGPRKLEIGANLSWVMTIDRAIISEGKLCFQLAADVIVEDDPATGAEFASLLMAKLTYLDQATVIDRLKNYYDVTDLAGLKALFFEQRRAKVVQTLCMAVAAHGNSLGTAAEVQTFVDSVSALLT